jgi:hypothetical protein
MTTLATEGSAPQHLRALEHANKVRLARAELKRQVAAGRVLVAEIVVDCPWQARSMEVSELLMSQKRWGRERCRRLLLSIAVPENKAVGKLTERQRLALAAVLSGTRAAVPVPQAEKLPTPQLMTALSVSAA